MTTGPLEGIRILDLGQLLAGPFAATLLGDLGADVIKVEPPEGDGMRRLGPQQDGHGLWWKVSARNKRCVTLDLRQAEGRELVRRLATDSDILIENFRPGRLEAWKLGPTDLATVNERLIMVRISGFGQNSVGRDRPLFGRPAEALSGLLALTGFPDGPPVHVGVPVGDLMTSMMGALGALAALQRRSTTGRGEVIDLALFETPFRVLEWMLPAYDHLGVAPQRAGNQSPLGPVFAGVYQASDGRWLSTSAGTDRSLEGVLRVIGGEELLADERFATPSARRLPENHARLLGMVERWIAERTSDLVIRAFEASGAVISPVFDATDISSDPLFEERQMIVTIPDEDLGTLRMPGTLPKMLNAPSQVRWPGPRLGRHNHEIFSQVLGLTSEEIEELRAHGVV